MNVVKLIELFKNTLDVNQNKDAEAQLDQIHKITGFLPAVLQIIMESSLDMPIRQAAAIYFKNEVSYYWQEKKESKNPQELIYVIHEQDKILIRNSIVDALVLAPEVIRITLAMALNYIIKFDFPDRWNGVVEKIHLYLQTQDPNNWMGALQALLQLTKDYEYKSTFNKKPLIDAMKILAPQLHKLMLNILPDQSEQSVLMQKTILKILFILTQYSLPLELFTNEFFTQWMEIIRQVLDRPVPPECNQVDLFERYDLPWYKAKKWALHFVCRIFDRYGPTKDQTKEYKNFGKWYMETFSLGMIQVILKLLDQYSQKMYLPPRVLQQCINYLNNCVEHIYTWKLLKPNISSIIEKVIFPLLCHNEEDDELWHTDPEEYVRRKFDFFEDYVSPVSAAQLFLNTCCKKRKDMLKNTIGFAVQVLNSPISIPQYKDGALHMLGSVSELMFKKKCYNQQINDLLGYHVFPYFQCETPFLRARAAWILHFFEDFDFKQQQTLFQAVNCLQISLIQDNDLPVKVQSAISLQTLINKQEKAKQILEPNLDKIILECLNLIKISQNDDLCNGLQRMICSYGVKIHPISLKIIENLVIVMEQILSEINDNNDTTITIMSLLNTIDTILMFIRDQETILMIEKYVMKCVLSILEKNLFELYEECFNIITTLTDDQISEDMWKFYYFIYETITKKEDGVDYFNDMIHALYNFLTVDPQAFLSDQNRILAFYEMSKFLLKQNDLVEDIYCNCIKMIEVFLLQYREKISQFIPLFFEIILEKYFILRSDERTKELKNLCLQTLLLVLYLDSELFLQILEKLPQQKFQDNKNLLNFLLEEWLQSLQTFAGLHDRKVCILINCKLLQLPSTTNHCLMATILQELNKQQQQFIPDLLKLFDNLKEAYKAKANADCSTEDDDDESQYSESDDDDDDELNGSKEMDDENDTIDDNGGDNTNNGDDDDDDEDDDDEIDLNELTALEDFETTIDHDDSEDDEYILFRKTCEYLKQHEPQFYQLLFGQLNPLQIKILEDVFILAQRRQDAAESRRIEQSGGYIFSNQTIPTTFNFGAGITNNSLNPNQQQQNHH